MASVTKTATTSSVTAFEGTGSNGWSNPDNARVSDNTYASSLNVASEKYFCIYTFGFDTDDIPESHKVDGVKVEVECQDTGFSFNNANIYLRFGASDYSASSKSLVFPAFENWVALGSATALFGESSIGDDVVRSSNFGVAIKRSGRPSDTTFRIDSVRITVYHSEDDQTVRLAGAVSGDKIGRARLAHIPDPDKTVLSRLAQGLTADKTVPGRLSNTLAFLYYEPEWWDVSYMKRRPISFGTDHDELPVGYTASVAFFTGYEERIATDGILNEAIQHSSKPLVNFQAADDNYYTVYAWTDTEGNIYVRKQTRTGASAGCWGSAVDTGLTGSGTDTHFYPNIVCADDGKLWIFWGGHNNDTKYAVSSAAYDETAWGSAQTLSGVLAYPRPLVDNNGDILVFLRGASSTEKMGFFRYDASASSWDPFKYIANYSVHKYLTALNTSIYCGGVAYDSSGDRIHVVLCWWDGYGNTNYNIGRAVSHIYSDDSGSTWYDLQQGSLVGNASTSSSSTEVVTYLGNATAGTSAPTKIFLSGDEDDDGTSEGWPGGTATSAPYYFTNTEACALDSRGYPYFLVQEIQDYKEEPCELWLARWSGSAWAKTNLSALSGGQKLFTHRTGGNLYVDDGGIVWVYGFVYDASAGDSQFAGERFRWRGLAYGTSWSAEWQTKNTAFGHGAMAVLPEVPYGGAREIIYCRDNDIFWTDDRYYPYVRQDGGDVRIVRQQMDAYGEYTNTEHDRLPDRFQAEDTAIYFKLQATVAQDSEHPGTEDRYWIYYNKYNATNAPNDPDNVYTFFEDFETYVATSDMDGQGGWFTSATANTYRPINHYDLSEWDQTGGSKIVGGAQCLLCYYPDTTPPYFLAKAVSWSDVRVSWWMGVHINPDNFNFVDLYESGGGWVRLGSIGNYCYYERSGDGTPQYSSKFALPGRYHHYEAVISGSSVSLYVDGATVLASDPEVSSVASIRIGTTGTLSRTVVDKIVVTKYVANAPALTLGDEEGEDNVETYRVAHGVSTHHAREIRLAQDMDMQRSASERLAHGSPLWKETVRRIASSLSLEREEATRLAHLIAGDKFAVKRLAHGFALEAEEKTLIANAIVADKVLTERVAQTVIPDKTTLERLAADLDLDKETVTRLAHISVMDKEDVTRLAHDLDLHWEKVIRVAHALVCEKEVVERLAHTVDATPTGSVRIANLLALWAETTERLAQTVAGDKVTTARLSQTLDADKEATERLSSALVVDKVLSERVAHMLTPDKEYLSRVANALQVDKETVTRLAHIAVSDKTDLERLANDLDLHWETVLRLVHGMVTDKEVTARLAHDAPLSPVEITRLANILDLWKQTTGRLAQAVVGDKADITRLAQALTTDKELSDRVAHAVVTDRVLTDRVANLLTLDRIKIERLANALDLDKVDIAYLANLIVCDKVDIERLANTLDLRYEETLRLAHSLAVDKEKTTRLAHTVDFSSQTITERLANILELDRAKTNRLAQTITPDREMVSRLAHLLISDKILVVRLTNTAAMSATATERLASHLSTDKTTLVRLCQTLVPDAIEVERIANDLSMAYQVAIRVSHTMIPDREIASRMANALALVYGFSSIVGLHFTNESMASISMTGEDMVMMSMSNDTFAAISMTGEDMKSITFDDETMTGISFTNETFKSDVELSEVDAS